MFFLNGKNTSLSYSILNKVYFANLITTIAIICIIVFGLNMKFDDISDDMHLSNKNLKNVIASHALAVNDELSLLSRYIASENVDIKTILDYSLGNSQEYHQLYVLNSKGDIEITTVNNSEQLTKHLEFFKSKPWENKFIDGVYRSEFSFHYGEIPTRFVAKEIDGGRILVAEIKLSYIYDELMKMYNQNSANSFIIDRDGKILFHQDIDLVLKQKSIFDIYDMSEDYMSKDTIGIHFGTENFDVYLLQDMPEGQVEIVSYRPVSNILTENWMFLLVCAIFLMIGLFLISADVKFSRNGVVKPILFIKKIIKKIEKEESIGRYVDTGYITDFNEMIESLVRIQEDFQAKKDKFLEYERKFGYLFEQGPLIILLIDAKTGEIIDASAKALEFYGYSKDEIVQKKMQDLDSTSDMGANILTCGYSDGTIAYEASQKMSNGEVRDVMINKKSIEVGENKFGFCIIEDITWDKINRRNLTKENEAHMYSPIFKISWKGRFLQDISSVSINAERMIGYRVEELLDKDFNFKSIIHPDDYDRILNEFNIKFRLFGTASAKQEYESLQSCRIVKKNLETLDCTIFIKFISADNKNIDEMIGYFVDNALINRLDTKQAVKQSLAAISRSNGSGDNSEYKSAADRYKKMISHIFAYSKEAIAIVGADGKFIEINDVFTQITGYEKDEIIGKTANTLNSGIHDRKFFANLWQKVLNDGYWNGHIWNKRKNGEKYLELLTISTIYGPGGDIENFIAIFSDISSAEARESNLEQMAYYDSLTKLPNRFLFTKKLGDAIKNADRMRKFIAVVYIDIDDFKPINDLHGHAAGDKFLIEASKNISSILGENDTLARVGGDEFVAIINDLTDKKQVHEIIEDMLRAANRNIIIGGKKLKASVSIGVSLYPQKTEVDQDLLLDQADWAMYQSKLAGKNKYYIFDTQADRYFKDNYSIADRISASLANNEFSVLYQPILNIKTNTIIGLESFIARKIGNAVLCEEILPIMAKGYIYDDLVLWNISSALKGQKLLAERYGLNLKVSVGVTLELIHRIDFIAKFKSLIESGEYKNLHMLELNIKESNMFKRTDNTNEVLNIYKDNGVTLALDQFGSNSASLQTLRDIQVDKLKVSKYLSMSIVRETDSLIILRAILALSNTFSKETVAKGVETSESMYLLIKAGYENLQGGFIAPAMDIENIKSWFESYEIPKDLKKIEPLKENELIWCNLAVMHRGWIRSLLNMLSASNLSRFDTKDFAKEYTSMMINSYKKYIADDKKAAIHVEISDIIMNILTNIEKKESISKLVLLLKEKRNKILNLE